MQFEDKRNRKLVIGMMLALTASVLAPISVYAENASDAPTRTANVDARKFSYRMFGHGTPVIFIHRFRGTMDDWDPEFIDGVAKQHTVVLFDNAGVSGSTGKVQPTLDEAADDTVKFANAIGIKKAAVVGWSMGGMTAQLMAVRHPEFTTASVVIGAAPPGPQPFPLTKEFLNAAVKPTYSFEDQITLFFTNSKESRAAAKKSLDRIASRKNDLEPQVSTEAWHTQNNAIEAFHADKEGNLRKVEQSRVPLLVMNGNQDASNAIDNWYALGASKIENAEFHVFPDSAHASMHQYPERAAQEINAFLASKGQ
jgi:pimeloyl-ACP methyl ester carboxylesterase